MVTVLGSGFELHVLEFGSFAKSESSLGSAASFVACQHEI